VQENVLERKLITETQTHHDHACDPEEDNITASFQKVSGEESLEIGVLSVRPAESREGEQTRGEPGIEHVLVLRESDLFLGHSELLGSFLFSLCLVSANNVVILVLVVGVVNDAGDLNEIGGDAVAPPELPRDTPVLNLL
jgi:hypothetical protein